MDSCMLSSPKKKILLKIKENTSSYKIAPGRLSHKKPSANINKDTNKKHTLPSNISQNPVSPNGYKGNITTKNS